MSNRSTYIRLTNFFELAINATTLNVIYFIFSIFSLLLFYFKTEIIAAIKRETWSDNTGRKFPRIIGILMSSVVVVVVVKSVQIERFVIDFLLN